MVNSETPLPHHFLEVAQRQTITRVPPNAEDEYVILELASPEQRGAAALRRVHGGKSAAPRFATEPDF